MVKACCVKRACVIVAATSSELSVSPASQLAEHVQSSTNGHLFGVHSSDIFLLLLKPITETSFTDEFVLIALLLNRSVYVDHHHYMS